MLNNKYTILITGIGAIIGQGVLKSLKNCSNDFNILGLDINANTYAKDWCDVFIKKPNMKEDDYEYLKFWESIIKKYNIDLIIPAIELDIHFFNKNKSFFSNKVKIVLNNKTLIELCNDKWNFYKHLCKKNIKCIIPTILPTSWEYALIELGKPPYILKPKKGSASKDIVTLYDKNDFDYWTNKQKNSILQKFIGDDLNEYTVGTFGLGNGDILKPSIVFKRTLSKDGSTKYAETVNNKAILDEVEKLSKIFNPIGPTNFQFRIENNLPYLLEINPRLSSSNSLRTLFGYNEALMIVDFYIKNKIPDIPKLLNGKAWRYYEDKLKLC